MGLTVDFIRALSGLSEAELPTSNIDTLQVIPMAELASENYTFDTPHSKLYYQGYKAITLLGPSLLLSVPESIKDNFNSFSRYDNLQKLLDLAAGMVAEVETVSTAVVSLLDVVSPDVDPVTQEAR